MEPVAALKKVVLPVFVLPIMPILINGGDRVLALFPFIVLEIAKRLPGSDRTRIPRGVGDPGGEGGFACFRGLWVFSPRFSCLGLEWAIRTCEIANVVRVGKGALF